MQNNIETIWAIQEKEKGVTGRALPEIKSLEIEG